MWLRGLGVDEGSADEKASADLGTIRVKVSRVIRTGLGQLSTVIRSPPAAATVHERNKKHVLGGQSISYVCIVDWRENCDADAVHFNMQDRVGSQHSGDEYGHDTAV